MVYHIMCEVQSEQEKALDEFLTGKMKKFWLSNPGVSRYHVYGDHLANKLERIVTIEVGDFGNFDKILALDERKELRNELMTVASHVQSRVLQMIE
ncbi:hypothetical protein MELA_02432 [Candidatus Methylomirabilis lanthanidiphila]|uniref:Uncharacterized protein n=1 Tax=Candidatus Methylomirabilis lanthanidiphila TaxID=2211376 RepID=A0A564ZNB7_9BACT|nr:hypothetical protein [Candidatus Methylomirabilis lanthanidiphila]VUZ86038.1 hypothetical protein MELA_02432 [Candidatus Methylomirabilis lanthanidiphila]